jgi:hypothetical protein
MLVGVLLTLCSVVAQADDHLDLSTPESAIRTRFEVRANADHEAYAQTTHFPDIQMYPDDSPPRVLMTPDELPESAVELIKFTLISTEILAEENDFALARVIFDIEAPNLEQTGVAWWGLKRTDGQWRITWRQFLGPIADQ